MEKSLYLNFYSFHNNNKTERLCRDTSKRVVCAERFNRTITNPKFILFFKKRNANCTDILPNFTQKYNKTVHSTIKSKPTQESLKKMKTFSTTKKKQKRRIKNKKKQMCKVVDLV